MKLELSLALSSNIYETMDLIGLGFFFFLLRTKINGT